jgi:hypothetical protein
MIARTKMPAIRLAAILLVAEMLVFTLWLVPKHVATSEIHDHCEICAVIHHPPTLQTGIIRSFQLSLQSDFLALPEAQLPTQEPQVETGLSRAPPSLI